MFLTVATLPFSQAAKRGQQYARISYLPAVAVVVLHLMHHAHHCLRCGFTALILLYVWYQKEDDGICLSLNINDTNTIVTTFLHEYAPGTSTTKATTNSSSYNACEYSTLCLMTAVLLCRYSKPSEMAAVCVVPPAVAVCVHHAYPA